MSEEQEQKKEESESKIELRLSGDQVAHLRVMTTTDGFRDSFNDGGTFRDTFGDGGHWNSSFNNMLSPTSFSLRHPAIQEALKRIQEATTKSLILSDEHEDNK